MKSAYWIRQDVRIEDNKCLFEFLNSEAPQFAFWTPSSSFLRAQDFRKNFILEGLFELKESLKKLNVDFYILKRSLPDLLKDWPFPEDWKIFFTQEVCPEEIQEEKLVLSSFQGQTIDQNSLIDLHQLPFSIDETPEIFTQFRKIVEKDIQAKGPFNSHLQKIKPSESSFLSMMEQWTSSDLNSVQHPKIIGGESKGKIRLKEYFFETKCLSRYKETRNGMLNWNDSSKFSPWLSQGHLSAKTIYQKVKEYEEHFGANESTYWMIFELLWRDYFRLIALKKKSNLFKNSFAQKTEDTIEAEKLFLKWKTGETGEPFIDANMRELKQTGWMSNRGRQNVARYLAKILNLDWTLGASYFEEMLIDYDPSSNWGNWAYLAGVGQDPRNRTFNIKRQSEVYDPQGEYQKKWLNEAI